MNPGTVTNFFGRLDKKFFSDLVTCSAGLYSKVLGHTVVRKLVTEYQVAYCRGGSGFITCGAITKKVGPGDIFINIPNHAHSYWADNDNPWTLSWVHFTGSSAQRYFTLMNCKPEEPAFTVGLQPQLRSLFDQLLYEIAFTELHHQIKALATLHQILAEIISLRTVQKEMVRNRLQPVPIINIQAIDTFINKNFETASLKNLAALCNKSVPHFMRLFKQRTGYSPNQYITLHKITHASILLASQPEMSIKNIAHSIGCEDQQYFSRMFTKATGQSPRAYRKVTTWETRPIPFKD